MNYFKILSYAIKNKKIKELVDLKFQSITDSWRRKRKQEYSRISTNVDDTLLKIFPDKKIKLEIPSELEEHLENFKKINELKKCPTIDNPYPINFGLDRNFGRLLFSICKLLKPDIVIETGVANGYSSAYFLSAMNFVNYGKLISIDKPFLPWHTKVKIGRAIPNSLKNRHTLIVGNAITELEKLLKSINEIDFFIHDSAHTYKNMISEFRIVWPHIKKDGFLMSDDVSAHDAFLDFSDEVDRKPIIIFGGEYGGHFGLIQK